MGRPGAVFVQIPRSSPPRRRFYATKKALVQNDTEPVALRAQILLGRCPRSEIRNPISRPICAAVDDLQRPDSRTFRGRILLRAPLLDLEHAAGSHASRSQCRCLPRRFSLDWFTRLRWLTISAERGRSARRFATAPSLMALLEIVRLGAKQLHPGGGTPRPNGRESLKTGKTAIQRRVARLNPCDCRSANRPHPRCQRSSSAGPPVRGAHAASRSATTPGATHRSLAIRRYARLRPHRGPQRKHYRPILDPPLATRSDTSREWLTWLSLGSAADPSDVSVWASRRTEITLRGVLWPN
jgi:hypothetical protein